MNRMLSTRREALLQELPIEKLQRGKYQPRRYFGEVALQELADSIQSQGLIQPIVVRPVAGGNYEIIAGERRWRACQRIGVVSVRCLISYYDDEQAAAITTIENLQRENLNPIEEALAYKRLIDDFHYQHDEVAEAVGKSRSKISNALRLLKLDKVLQELLKEGKLSEGHGKLLVSVPLLSEQYTLAQQCVKHEWSVRKLEQEIKKVLSADGEHDRSQPGSQLKHLENALSVHVGSPVAINYHEGKGNVVIDFHDLDILEGILKRLQFRYETNE